MEYSQIVQNFLNRKTRLFLLGLFLLTACSTTRMPWQGVARMSNDTLCYRAAYASGDPAINAEIKSRHLDCEKYQGSDPLDR